MGKKHLRTNELDTYMIIPVYHRSKGTQDMLIDEEDYELIKHYNWRLSCSPNSRTYYAVASVFENKKYVKRLNIHRLIMGLDDYKKDPYRIINHINGDGLDNRKSNLEICNTMYNNQSMNKRNKSFGVVYKDTSGGRVKIWRYVVHINGRRYQKRFCTKQKAIHQLCMLELIVKSKPKNLFPK